MTKTCAAAHTSPHISLKFHMYITLNWFLFVYALDCMAYDSFLSFTRIQSEYFTSVALMVFIGAAAGVEFKPLFILDRFIFTYRNGG